MRRWCAWLLLPLLLVSIQVAAQGSADPVQQITDLDQLLQAVREEQQAQRERNRQREQKFLQDRKNQQALLEQARRDFERRQRENQPLVTKTEANAAQITRLEKELEAVVQDMGDLSTGFREFAGDFAAVLQESMISAQFPDRGEQLRGLAATQSQPSIEEIENLWLLVQEEMTEAGKVALFPAAVVRADGSAGNARYCGWEHFPPSPRVSSCATCRRPANCWFCPVSPPRTCEATRRNLLPRPDSWHRSRLILPAAACWAC